MSEKQKKAAQGDLNQCVLFDGRNNNKRNTIVRLNETELEKILVRLSPTSNHERTFFQMPRRLPFSITLQCRKYISHINLSHLRAQTDEVMIEFVLAVGCIHPDNPITNEYKGEQLRGLCRATEGGRA